MTGGSTAGGCAGLLCSWRRLLGINTAFLLQRCVLAVAVTQCSLQPVTFTATLLSVNVQIKAQKLHELVASGVPERFTAELARMRIKNAK